MLDAFIIEELRKRDEEILRRDERPAVRVPPPTLPDENRDDEQDDNERPRVVIIDL